MTSSLKFLSLLFLHFYNQATASPLSSTFLCLPNQSHALLVFKNSFSLAAEIYELYAEPISCYPKTQSWKDGTDCCSWDGVTCDFKTGYVIGLNLSHSMLYGSIHSDNSLFSLSHLEMLDLSWNDFNGSHTSSRFGFFFDLAHLNLSHSNFTGQVPSEISLLSNLVSLDLSMNFDIALDTNTFNKLVQNLTMLRDVRLSGVNMSTVAPPSFLNLSSSLLSLELRSCGFGQKFVDYIPLLPSRLVSLDLSGNVLKLDNTAFIKIFQNLSNLRVLELNGLNLSSVEPSSFLNLPSSLLCLSLQDCGLKGKFPYIFHLSNLNSIYLSSNDELSIDGIAFNRLVQNLTNLREVDLGGVNMSLVAPIYFHNLSYSLSYLFLVDCGLRGELPDIFHLSNLDSIDLSFNDDLAIDGIAFNRLVQNLTNLRKVYLMDVNMSLVEPIYLQNFSSSLSSLSLRNSGLRGEFPGSFVQRQYLQELELSFIEDLKGFLPTSNWSTSLSRLRISDTKLVVPPLEFFGNLTQLSYLDLSHCNISGQLPSSFQNLKHLSTLQLSFNNLSGRIPNIFSNFTVLEHLDLSNNQLTGPIPSLSLPYLLIINLSNNQLTGPIPSLSLPFIVILSLSNNQLTGRIPSLSFPYLFFLCLSNNQLTGPIPSLSHSNYLSSLDISNNELSGTIPSSLFTQYLNLKNNQLHGPIPSFQSNAFRYIDLSNNLLHGPIPNSIFNKKNLSGLILSSNNKLTGEVSSSFCKLQYLDILDLSNNSFIGSIPPCLSNKSLSVLHLGINHFEGTIPDTFSKDCRLRYLNFNANQLEGQVPQSIINCKGLELVDLSNNKINDKFPHFLGILPQLQGLVIHSNKFHGWVKRFNLSCSFPKLRIFDMSNNSFSGPLPAEYFDHFEAMMNSDHQMSYMRSNRTYIYNYSVSLTLKGLETELVKILNTFTTIDLSCNNFIGKIPESMGKLQSLILLNLSHNYLTNDIPPSLANLTNLESLDLSSNMLSGRIPPNLVDLTFLQVFNVAHNQLEGLIPQGKQFNTFDNNSYEGNSGLCGFPLENCDNGEAQHPTSLKQDESEFENGFGWKAVATGYGCGVAFGLAIGYLVFRIRKPAWFVRMVEGEGKRMPKRFKKNLRSHGRRN